ncbi:MAG TPA: AAA family ATPase [Solirubrobacterales bacterium]|nr:AAA family ATPase [Solirubrobacterales bacterium]HNA24431.1 AAA family ATPase [Solirubrobacterales bacterium]HNA45116.1 AAA family ATPase [Solirubrobacterales bacterium]HNC93495.1 AAA family ATPase [Solirubrobacterales bacterium]HNE77460.1 AAA family ATPase [Solirubrobacterales bacterium]
MRILSRKNQEREKQGPEVETVPEVESAVPEPVAPAATATVEPNPGPVEAAATPAEPATPPELAAPAEPATPAEPAAVPVEEELAEVEEAAAAEETEIRLKAADLLAPSRRDLSDHLKPVQPEQPVDMAEVISFANQKGGVAKTTSTLNLAVALSELGNRVLCIDLDPQGNLTMSQGIDPDKCEKSMYDVLVDDLPISEVIAHREIDIAVASIDLAGAEIAMSTKIGRERSLEKALKEVHSDYDYICIDTPPSLGLLTINALTASSKVIVPVQCEYLSMRGLVQLQSTLKMIQENLNPNVHIEGILPTMFDSRTLHAREAVFILEENFGDLVFKSRIRKAVKFAEAPVRGASVLKYDPESRAASYYRNLAKEVLSDGSS